MCFLGYDWYGKALLTVIGAMPVLQVLGAVKKQAEQVTRSKPAALLHGLGFLLPPGFCLESLP